MNWKTLLRTLMGDVACVCEAPREMEPWREDEKWIVFSVVLFLIACAVFVSFHLANGYWWHQDRALRLTETCLRSGQKFTTCYEILRIK